MTVQEWIDQRTFRFDSFGKNFFDNEDYYDFNEQDSIGSEINAEPVYQKLKHTGLFR